MCASKSKCAHLVYSCHFLSCLASGLPLLPRALQRVTQTQSPPGLTACCAGKPAEMAPRRRPSGALSFSPQQVRASHVLQCCCIPSVWRAVWLVSVLCSTSLVTCYERLLCCRVEARVTTLVSQAAAGAAERDAGLSADLWLHAIMTVAVLLLLACWCWEMLRATHAITSSYLGSMGKGHEGVTRAQKDPAGRTSCALGDGHHTYI